MKFLIRVKLARRKYLKQRAIRQLELAATHETRRQWIQKRRDLVEEQLKFQEEGIMIETQTHEPSEWRLQSTDVKELEQFELDLLSVFPTKKTKKNKPRKEKKKIEVPESAIPLDQKDVNIRKQQKSLLINMLSKGEPQRYPDLSLSLFQKNKTKKSKKRTEKSKIMKKLAVQVNDILEEQDGLDTIARRPENLTATEKSTISEQLAK